MTATGHDLSPSMAMQNPIHLNFGKRTAEFGFVCSMDFAYLYNLSRLSFPKKRFQQLFFFLIGQIPSMRLVVILGNSTDSIVTITCYNFAYICRILSADRSYFS